MSKGDWLVLCALIIEREHGFRHAMHMVKRAVREDLKHMHGPSTLWWFKAHTKQILHEMREEGYLI